MNTKETLSYLHSIPLPSDGWHVLETKAQKLGIDLTELWQKIASQEIILIEAEELEDLLDTISGLEGLLSAKEEGTIPWEQIKSEVESDD